LVTCCACRSLCQRAEYRDDVAGELLAVGGRGDYPVRSGAQERGAGGVFALAAPAGDVEDELGELTHAELTGLEIGTGRSKFERKVRTYLRSHDDNLVVQKLLRGRQITSADLGELKSIFLDLGFGTEADIDRTTEEHEGFGLFLRAITGLSREAAVQAFSDFQRGRTLSAAEYAFVDLLIESLTQNGYLDVGELYEPPFERVGDPDVLSVPACVTLSRCRPRCCGVHGRIADGVRACLSVGVTVGFPRTATDGPRRRRVPV
jgi:hypothetical protein